MNGRMKAAAKAIAVSAAGFLAASRPAPAQPAALHGSNVAVEKTAPGGLEAAIRRLGSAGTVWVAWAAPLEDRRERMCCFEGWDKAERWTTPGHCALAKDESFNMTRGDEDGSPLEGADTFLLFARFSGGRVERLRHFSLDCRVDAGNARVVWLEGVRAEETVAWLEALALRASAPGGQRRSSSGDEDGEDPDDTTLIGPAVGAIALVAGPAAQASLDRLVEPARPAHLRKKTAFWLAAERGIAGCRRLEAIVPDDGDFAFRKHGTFALSLCHDRESTDTLIRMARRDPTAKVRSQALFWLAQKAGRAASGALGDAVRDDPDAEVKKQAVFAFTQMPDGQGIPELIRIARTNRNPEVRERAVFWLGQSGDPRALDFIEEVLTGASRR